MFDFKEDSTSQSMLSAIIPVYNGAATLGEQLEALQRQTYQGDWEIIIVDNRSRDNSVEVVRAYQQKTPRLRFVQAYKKQNKGYACNVGVQVARGNKLIFCDQDDVVSANWLSAFAEALTNHHVCAGVLELESLNQSSPQRPVFPNGAQTPILDFLPHVSGCNLAVSREAFDAVEGFAEDCPILDDIDFTWRLQLKGYTIYDVPDAIVHYRYRETYWGLWKQIEGYAYAQPNLYRRFAKHGMPPRPIRKTLTDYKQLIRNLPYCIIGSRRKQSRERWIFNAAACWGRIRGSLRYRVMYI